MTQARVIEIVKEMPNDFNVDELIERLVILEKIEEAEDDIKAGRTHTHTEVINAFEEWKK